MAKIAVRCSGGPVHTVQDVSLKLPKLKDHFPRLSHCSVSYTHTHTQFENCHDPLIWTGSRSGFKLNKKYIQNILSSSSLAFHSFPNTPSAEYLFPFFPEYPFFRLSVDHYLKTSNLSKTLAKMQFFQVWTKEPSVFPNLTKEIITNPVWSNCFAPPRRYVVWENFFLFFLLL